MAIKKDWTDERRGLDVAGAYYRVERVAVDTRARTAELVVNVYASKAVSDANGEPLATMGFGVRDEPEVTELTARRVVDGAEREVVVRDAVPARPLFTDHFSGAPDSGIVAAAYRFLKAERPEFEGSQDA